MSVSVLYFSNIVIHFIFTNVTFRVLNALVWVQFSPYSSGILDISPDSLSRFLPPMPLFEGFKPIFLRLPGILCLPFVSLSLQIDTRAPETWVICVIRHNEQHPFLQLRYRFAPAALQTNLCSACAIMQPSSVK